MLVANVYQNDTNFLEEIGSALVVKVLCENRQLSMKNKQIIFVVDKSASMEEAIPSLKASLFAARNSILIMMKQNTENEEAKDSIFSAICNTSIIAFSDEAKCIWDSKNSTNSFSSAVNSLQTEYSTNMGHALEIAFEKANNDNATWIILLTDGISNRGDYQTIDAFKKLSKLTPKNTKIIPLGYSTEFDPKILNTLGVMTYLNSRESIAETFGMIMGEIVSCYGINAKINLPEICTETELLGPDDIIPVASSISNPTDLIGSSRLGCIFNDRKYIYGYLPFGTEKSELIKNYLGKTGELRYFDLSLQQIVSETFVFTEGSTFDDEIIESYFEYLKGKIILKIYEAKQNSNKDSLRKIIKNVQKWSHPLSIKHKEEIIRIASVRDESENLTFLTQAGSVMSQTSYRLGRFATPSQQRASTISIANFDSSSLL